MVISALFTPIVASRRYALLERPPYVSVDARGGGTKGATENVHTFVIFLHRRLAINDSQPAIFVVGSFIIGKQLLAEQKYTIFTNWLKIHPKVFWALHTYHTRSENSRTYSKVGHLWNTLLSI